MGRPVGMDPDVKKGCASREAGVGVWITVSSLAGAQEIAR